MEATELVPKSLSQSLKLNLDQLNRIEELEEALEDATFDLSELTRKHNHSLETIRKMQGTKKKGICFRDCINFFTEKWYNISGFGNLYQVSNKGRVRSLDRMTGQNRFLHGALLSIHPRHTRFRVTIGYDGKIHQFYVDELLRNAKNKKEEV